jgi:hypothetical protein
MLLLCKACLLHLQMSLVILKRYVILDKFVHDHKYFLLQQLIWQVKLLHQLHIIQYLSHEREWKHQHLLKLQQRCLRSLILLQLNYLLSCFQALMIIGILELMLSLQFKSSIFELSSASQVLTPFKVHFVQSQHHQLVLLYQQSFILHLKNQFLLLIKF